MAGGGCRDPQIQTGPEDWGREKGDSTAFGHGGSSSWGLRVAGSFWKVLGLAGQLCGFWSMIPYFSIALGGASFL